jgi:aryl carrier-like protein
MPRELKLADVSHHLPGLTGPRFEFSEIPGVPMTPTDGETRLFELGLRSLRLGGRLRRSGLCVGFAELARGPRLTPDLSTCDDPGPGIRGHGAGRRLTADQ